LACDFLAFIEQALVPIPNAYFQSERQCVDRRGTDNQAFPLCNSIEYLPSTAFPWASSRPSLVLNRMFFGLSAGTVGNSSSLPRAYLQRMDAVKLWQSRNSFAAGLF